MTTEQEQFFAQGEARPEPPRNQWGQYLIPDPETGEDRACVRATTWCKTLAETFALEQWGLRQVLVGVAKREDLLTLVQSIRDPDSEDAKKTLNGIASKAKEAAGVSMRSNLGTALHAFAEQQDMGLDPQVPQKYQPDLAAYHQAKADHGIIVHPHLMERVIVNWELGVAGTFDRLVSWGERPGLYVGDLKTGRTMMHSWAEAIIQQAIYSRADYIFDVPSKTLQPMPQVDQHSALIFHLPVGEGLCHIYELPHLDDAWDMALTAGKVRKWRKRKDLAKLLEADDPFEAAADEAAPTTSGDWSSPEGQGVVTPGEPGLVTQAGEVSQGDAAGVAPALATLPEPQDRTEWLLGRLAVVKQDEAARARMVELWPTGVPKASQSATWTAEHHAALIQALTIVEAEHCVSFPEHSDPEAPKGPAAKWAKDRPLPDAPKNGRKVSAERVAQLKAAALELPPEAVQVVKAWMREGADAQRPWEPVGTDYHARVWSVTLAALSCAASFPDDTQALTRALLAFAWGAVDKPGAWSTSWATGAILGCLTAEQANEVRRMAEEFSGGSLDTAVQLGDLAVLEP